MRHWLDQFTRGVPIGFGGMLVFVILLGAVTSRERAPSVDEGDPLRVEEAFSTIMATCAQGPIGMPRDIFQVLRDSESFLIPGRVLARAYPARVIPMARRLAFDVDAPRDRRQYALIMLGHLACVGLPAAQEALADLARRGDLFIQRSALDLLADSDLEGKYRSLYCLKALEGQASALGALARMDDAATRLFLERLANDSPGRRLFPDSTTHAARDALNRRRRLEGADLPELVHQILSSDREDRWWIRWALNACGSLSFERRIPILSGRLIRLEPRSNREPGQEYFETLIRFWELGGPLAPYESTLLFTHGYSSDPRERLEWFLPVLRESPRRYRNVFIGGTR